MTGKTALTTGANSGIGLATVIELARRGYRSVGTARSEAKADAIAKAAADAGVDVEVVQLDVTDAAGCERVISELRPYALVNNAGFSSIGAVEDVSDVEVHQVLDTMLVAPMRLARLSLPFMRDARGGRVVNVSSIYGRITTPLSGWYQAAKHGLEAVSDALRAEVASSGVKVVLVEPGGFKTGIWEGGHAQATGREGSRYRTAYERTVTGTRLTQPIMGEPAQVAKVIAGAVDGRNPRARYLVGLDAQALTVFDRLTPTEIKDRVARLLLGL